METVSLSRPSKLPSNEMWSELWEVLHGQDKGNCDQGEAVLIRLTVGILQYSYSQ